MRRFLSWLTALADRFPPDDYRGRGALAVGNQAAHAYVIGFAPGLLIPGLSAWISGWLTLWFGLPPFALPFWLPLPFYLLWEEYQYRYQGADPVDCMTDAAFVAAGNAIAALFLDELIGAFAPLCGVACLEACLLWHGYRMSKLDPLNGGE